MFKKKNVYKVGSIKYTCILVDSEYAVLVPIQPHKKDNGYKLLLNKSAICSPDMSLMTGNVEKIGAIKEGRYIKTK